MDSVTPRDPEQSRKQAIMAGTPYIVTKQFPWKLHEMLDRVEKSGDDSIVSWLPGGKAFKVHRPDVFVSKIMKEHFNQSKYKSFQRQLNLWGFERNNKDSLERGSYYHPLFIKGRKDLCQEMGRQKIKGGTPMSATKMPSACSAASITPPAEETNTSIPAASSVPGLFFQPIPPPVAVAAAAPPAQTAEDKLAALQQILNPSFNNNNKPAGVQGLSELLAIPSLAQAFLAQAASLPLSFNNNLQQPTPHVLNLPQQQQQVSQNDADMLSAVRKLAALESLMAANAMGSNNGLGSNGNNVL